MKKLLTKLFILLYIFVPVHSLSKESIRTFSLDLKNLEVVSVSKKPEKAFEAASAIFVISNEMIQRSGATSIAEVLRLAPGVEVSRIDANKWSISARGFGRQFSNKLLVMIDGKTFYNPLFAGTYWDILDTSLEDIDRIEVVRGPGGTLWGSNAVNGVINIITKNSKTTQGNYFSALAGSFERAIIEGRNGGKVNDSLHYRTFAKYHNNGSTNTLNQNSANDEWQSFKAGARIDWDRTLRDKIMFKFDVYSGNESQDYYFPGLTAPVNGDEKFKGLSFLTNWEHSYSDDSLVTAKFFYDYINRSIDSLLDQNRHTVDFELQNDIKINDRNDFSWGIGYRNFSNNIDPNAFGGITYINYTPQDFDGEFYSSFLQNKTALIADKLFLTYGSKFEYNYQTEFEPQPNVRISYLIDSNNTLWAAISKAIRMPSIAETGINRIVAPGITNVGNPSQDAEDLVAYELGYRTIFSKRLSLDTTLFYNVYRNLRSYTPLPSVSLSNLGHGFVYGSETSVDYYITNNWNISGSLSLQSVNLDLETGGTDPLNLFFSDENVSPTYQLKIQSNANLSDDFKFDNYIYFIDEIQPSRSYSVSEYVRFDTRLAWQARKNLEISLVGQNLLDNRHPEFSQSIYSLPTEIPRSGYLKMKITF